MWSRLLVTGVFLCLLCVPAAAQKIFIGVAKEAFPPMQFNAPDDVKQGFDVDLMRAICAHEGLEPIFVQVPWATLFDEVASRKLQASIGGTTITAERKKKVNFSDWYFEAKQTVIVRKKEDIHQEKDLEYKKVGAWGATTNFEECRKIARFNNVRRVLAFTSMDSAVQALTIGQVDAVFADSPTAVYYSSISEQFKDKISVAFIVPAENSDYFGFAVNKDEKELLMKINNGLKTVKSSGEYDKLYKKWLPGIEREKPDAWFQFWE